MTANPGPGGGRRDARGGGLAVRKTYKLYIGGEFVRSESGRSDRVARPASVPPANVPRGSRKDLREAVSRARASQPAWSSKSPYLKGQILYRMAEMLEARSESFESLLRDARGASAPAARKEVRAAIDRLVHYAGWADKFTALLGSVNPVASSYFDFSVPEATGVVAIVAPQTPELLGLVTHLAPVLVSGNTAVVLVSQRHPIAGLEFAEVLATSDLPSGAANLVSGPRPELVPHLARHMDVNAVCDAGGDADLSRAIAQDSAVNVKRVRRYRIPDYFSVDAQGLEFIAAFTEIKTTWHPIGV